MVTCPVCRQSFSKYAVDSSSGGPMVNCVCGTVFPAEPGNVIPPPVQNNLSAGQVDQKRRKTPIFAESDQKAAQGIWLSLLVVFFVVFMVGIALAVAASRNRKVPENAPEVVKPDRIDVKEIALPEAKAETVEEKLIELPRPAGEPKSIDAYEYLQQALSLKIPGLVFSYRAADAPGRVMRSDKQYAIVVMSDRPAKTEASFRQEKKVGWNTFVWRSFVFVGDPGLIEKIKSALGKP